VIQIFVQNKCNLILKAAGINLNIYILRVCHLDVLPTEPILHTLIHQFTNEDCKILNGKVTSKLRHFI
jgi:hypothetical protein